MGVIIGFVTCQWLLDGTRWLPLAVALVMFQSLNPVTVSNLLNLVTYPVQPAHHCHQPVQSVHHWSTICVHQPYHLSTFLGLIWQLHEQCSIASLLQFEHNRLTPLTLTQSRSESHKNVFRMKTSACRDGTLKNQPNKMRMTPQHIHTVPTSCQLCFVFVSCVHRRVVEGSRYCWVRSACWSDMIVSCPACTHSWREMFWWAKSNFLGFLPKVVMTNEVARLVKYYIALPLQQ